jgi:ankyrin repeat protein
MINEWLPIGTAIAATLLVLAAACVLLFSAKGTGAIHRAAAKGDVAKIAALLAGNRNCANRQDFFGGTPLQYAARYGQYEVVRLLSHAGADINAGRGRTPLQFAIIGNFLDIVTFLIREGAHVNARPRGSRRTALHCAVLLGRYDIARQLLELGADANAQDDYKDTPLHDAARSKDVRMVELLLQYGADRKIRNRWWLTPKYVWLFSSAGGPVEPCAMLQ